MRTVAEAVEYLERINSISISVRILMSMICGGVIGIERGRSRQPAGMRTYMLVCMGAAVVMMTGQYMMTLLRGCVLIYTKGSPIPVKIDSYKFIGKGTVLGVPVPVIILIALFLLAHYILTQTSFGRSIYAFGGNREAARLSGISVKKTEWMAYIINGLLSGIAAVVLTARLGSAQSTSGQGIEMDAIAAVILGGTSLSGGTGFVLPTVVGAMFSTTTLRRL